MEDSPIRGALYATKHDHPHYEGSQKGATIFGVITKVSGGCFSFWGEGFSQHGRVHKLGLGFRIGGADGINQQHVYCILYGA